MVQVSAQPDSLSSNSYVALGLATCYRQQDGETEEIQVLEPVPSAYLEAVFKGVATSYRAICGTTLEQAQNLTVTGLPPEQVAVAQPCTDFEARLLAAARTYQTRPQAMELVPLGTSRDDVNFSVEKKRVLNGQRKVSLADNVKQHKYTHEVL
jgi:hypothetical protein